MAIAHSNGSPASYGPDGTVAGQRTIGVIASQGFTKSENSGEMQRIIDRNRFILPVSPTYVDPQTIPGGNSSIEGVDSEKSHADDGENSIYNTPPTITIHGVEYPRFLPANVPSPWNQSRPGYNFKFPRVKAGANSPNSANESVKTVRSTNFKALTRAGGWNPMDGAFVPSPDTSYSGVIDLMLSDDVGDKEVASSLGTSDQGSYNPMAPMIISEGAQPVMFVAAYAPRSPRAACSYPPAYPNGGIPRQVVGKGSPRCTGTERYVWKAKRQITCTQAKYVPLALYIGWCSRFKDTDGEGLCYLYGDQSWMQGRSEVDCYKPPAGNTTYQVGTWLYNATPIGRTGNIITGQTPKSQQGKIAEREFYHKDTVTLECPDFTDAVYEAACAAVFDAGPPTFTPC